MSEKFEIPKFHYFRSGNPYSGSVKNFRFRIRKDEDLLKAWAWPGPNCQDASPEGDVVSAEFEMTEDGLLQAVNWLEAEEAKPRYHE